MTCLWVGIVDGQFRVMHQRPRRLTLRDIFVSLRSLVSSLSDVLTLANSRRMAAAAIMHMPVAA